MNHEEAKAKSITMNNIIILAGSKLNCDCGHQFAPHPSARHKLEFNTVIKACKTCGVDIMPLGTPEPVGKGLCQCCVTRPSTVRVEVSPGSWEPWCGDCLSAADAHMTELGLRCFRKTQHIELATGDAPWLGNDGGAIHSIKEHRREQATVACSTQIAPCDLRGDVGI